MNSEPNNLPNSEAVKAQAAPAAHLPQQGAAESQPAKPADAQKDMAGRPLWKKVSYKFVHGKGIFTFLRSSVSSQIASWTDMGVCFVFYAWVFAALDKDPLRSFLATAIGLVVGGVVNCCLNYKFPFRAEHCSVKAVALKYLLIWGGSFVLNIAGTTALNHLLLHIPLPSVIKPDGIFAFSRLSVSLIVSLAWNFLMQKNFVYVPTKFDPTAIRIVDTILLHHKKLEEAVNKAADKTNQTDNEQ